MADEVRIDGYLAKRRNPWGVWLLVLVTLGIYYLVWYYKINKELRDYPRADIKVDPLVSLLAIVLGGLIIIPPFVSLYNTGKRILAAQEASGTTHRVNPWIGLALSLIGFQEPYLQTELNKVWDEEFKRQTAPAA